MIDKDIKDVVLKMSDLIEKSEIRVDRCNDIIGKAYVLIDKITTEYTRQLAELQNARDELAHQNSELIQIVKESKAQLEYSTKRYDLLLEKVFGMVHKGSSENNINVSN